MKSLSLATVLRDRATCQIVSCAAVGHLTLVGLGLPSWQCPIRYGLGIPCPGCGLSRALMALAEGDWQRAIAIHAFAPVLLVGLVLIIAGAVLPSAYKLQLQKQIERWEQRLGITLLLISLFMVYWLVRIIFFNKELYRLVM